MCACLLRLCACSMASCIGRGALNWGSVTWCLSGTQACLTMKWFCSTLWVPLLLSGPGRCLRFALGCLRRFWVTLWGVLLHNVQQDSVKTQCTQYHFAFPQNWPPLPGPPLVVCMPSTIVECVCAYLDLGTGSGALQSVWGIRAKQDTCLGTIEILA